LTLEKKRKGKSIGHRKNEEKDEFDSPKSEFLCFKRVTPIMLVPIMVG
jgi:stalled ribosome alternative rescue factor ArfA